MLLNGLPTYIMNEPIDIFLLVISLLVGIFIFLSTDITDSIEFNSLILLAFSVMIAEIFIYVGKKRLRYRNNYLKKMIRGDYELISEGISRESLSFNSLFEIEAAAILFIQDDQLFIFNVLPAKAGRLLCA